MDPAKMKVVDLRSELGALGLDTKGNKAVLVERLKKALEAKTGNAPVDTTILDTSTEEADDEVVATPVKPAGPAARTRRRSSTLISTSSHPTPAKMPRTTISEADIYDERSRRRYAEKVQMIEDSDSSSGECILSDLPSRRPDKVSSPVSIEEEPVKYEEPPSADEPMEMADQKDDQSEEDIQMMEQKENEQPVEIKEEREDNEEEQKAVKEDNEDDKNEAKEGEELEEARLKEEEPQLLTEEEERVKQEDKNRLLEEEEEAERKRLEEIEKDPVKRERERRRKEKRSRWSNFYRTVENTNEVLNPDLELPKPEEKPGQQQQQQRGGARRSRFEPEPRRKSGVKEPSPVRPQPEPNQPEDKVMLSWYDSDLNQYIELPDMKFVTPISEGGFGHIWAGARATHGVKSGKVCYEVKIGTTVSTTEEVMNAIRIGFSTTDSTLHLGEGELSWAYESTGRAVNNSEFKEYGKKLTEKDVVGVYLDLDSSPCTLKYTVNGEDIGVAYEFEKDILKDAALFPHILTKNICYQVNLGHDKYSMLTKTKLVRRKIIVPVEVILEERRQKELEFQKAKEEELAWWKEREAELEKEKKDKQREKEKLKAKKEKGRADLEKEKEGDKDKKEDEEESDRVKEEKDSEAVKENGDADKYDPSEAMEDDDDEAAEEEAKKEKEAEEKDKEKESGEGQDKEEIEVEAGEEKKEVESSSAVKDDDTTASTEEGSSEVVEESAIINTIKLDPKIKSIIRYELDEELDGEVVELLEGYTLIARMPLDQLVLGPRQPANTGDCEVILMVGLPGAGKTYWARQHVASHPERRYNILSTGALVEKMKVDCKPFRATYEGRWDAMMTKLAKCVLRLLEIAHGRKRNFILDQTNVYPSAQRRKLREFGGYKRTAVVVVPDEATYETRQKQREQADGKDIPDGAILEMKANFTLPEKCSWVEEVVFTELGEVEAQRVLDQFSKEARAAGEERDKRDKSAQRETGRLMKKSRFDSGSERGGRDRSRQDGGRRDRNNSGGRGGPRNEFRRDDRRGGGRGGGWAGAREGRGGGGGAGRSWGEPLRDLRDVHVGGGWGGGGGRPDRAESRWGPTGGREGGRGGAHRSGPPDNFRGGPDNNFRGGPENFRGGPDNNFRGGHGGFQQRGGRSGPGPVRGGDRGPPMGGRGDRRPPMGGRDGPTRGGGHNRGGGGDRGGGNQQRGGPPSLFAQGMRPMQQPYGRNNNDEEPSAPSRGVPPPSGPLEKRSAGGGMQEGRGGTWQRGAAVGNQHHPQGRPNPNQGGGGMQGGGGGGFGPKNSQGGQQFGNRNIGNKPGGMGGGGGNPPGGVGNNPQGGNQPGMPNQANWNQWNNWNQNWGQQGWGQQGWGNWSGANQWNAAGNTWASGGGNAGGGGGNKGANDSNTQQWPAAPSQYNHWNQWPGYNWQQWPGYNQGAQGSGNAAVGGGGGASGAVAAGGGSLDTSQQQQIWAQYAQQYAQMGGYGAGADNTASTNKK